MATLITGGTGFIGSALAEALLRRGEQVHILGFPVKGSPQLQHPRCIVHYGDVRSASDVRAALHGCSTVYHLAACACAWLPRNDDFFDVNVRGTDTVLACSMAQGIDRVVVTSTNLTIGPATDGDITEDTIRVTDFYNTYERSKAAAEIVAHRYVRKGLPVVTVHPTRVFGPGPINEANSVTKMILWYLQGTWRLIPGTGEAIGNYVYLPDLIEGYRLAMRRGTPGAHYILGGANVSFNALFERIADVTGIHRRMIRMPAWAALPFAWTQEAFAGLTGVHPLITTGWTKVFLDNWTTSCAKAERELGYRITPLDQAIREVVQWMLHTGLFRPSTEPTFAHMNRE